MRTNVYIPDDLAAQLEALKGQINVSGVCQDALRREVQIMTITHDDATVARLKRSREQSRSLRDEQTYQDGVSAGAAWARDFAEWDDLMLIAEVEEPDNEFWQVDVRERSVVREDSNGRSHEMRILEGGDPWDRGFVRGAQQVLASVSDAVMDD